MCLKLVFIMNLCFLTGCWQNRVDKRLEIVTLKKEKPLVFDSPNKLIEFVDNNENGFVRLKTVDKITYSVILKPTDYLLAKKRIKENNPALSNNEFEDLQYFDLRVTIENFSQEFIKYKLSSANEYNDRVTYCAFHMQEDIKLIDGTDTLNCILYHYERAFDVVPFGHFTLAFEMKNKNTVSTKTILFNDQLFNNGPLKFTFSPELLVKEPVLL